MEKIDIEAAFVKHEKNGVQKALNHYYLPQFKELIASFSLKKKIKIEVLIGAIYSIHNVV